MLISTKTNFIDFSTYEANTQPLTRLTGLDVKDKPFISSDACTSPSKGGGYKFSISNFYTGENPF